jgi:glycogen synthase
MGEGLSISSLRIILYTPSTFGGAGRYTAFLFDSLRRRGVDVLWACSEAEDSDDCVAGKPTILRGRIGWAHQLNWFLRPLKLAVLIRRFRPDVVHIVFSSRFEVVFLLAILKIFFPNVNRVFTVHDPLPHYFVLPSAIELKLLKLTYALCEALIVHTEDGREILIKDFGKSIGHVVLVPHPIATNCAGTRNKRSLLSLLGTLRPDKDIVSLVKAYQRLSVEEKREMPLLIAGRDSKHFDIQALISTIDSDSTGITLFRGYVHRRAYETVLQCSRALILPYQDFHSASGVAADAHAFATPVFATRTYAMGEMIEAGIANEWPSGLAHQLAVLTEIAHDNIIMKEFSAAPESKYSWDNLAGACLGVYRKRIIG